MPVIQCTDTAGDVWEVFEVASQSFARHSVSAHLTKGWLCFERNDGRKLRVAQGEFPADWASLETTALLQLMTRGRPSKPAPGRHAEGNSPF